MPATYRQQLSIEQSDLSGIAALLSGDRHAGDRFKDEAHSLLMRPRYLSLLNISWRQQESKSQNELTRQREGVSFATACDRCDPLVLSTVS